MFPIYSKYLEILWYFLIQVETFISLLNPLYSAECVAVICNDACLLVLSLPPMHTNECTRDFLYWIIDYCCLVKFDTCESMEYALAGATNSNKTLHTIEAIILHTYLPYTNIPRPQYGLDFANNSVLNNKCGGCYMYER